MIHYLGYAPLKERVKNSEIALNLIEKLVKKSIGDSLTNFDLLEKPLVKVTISANSINLTKVEDTSPGIQIPAQKHAQASITGASPSPDAAVTSKNIRTRYLAWIILSKNPKFLGVIEHADKFRIHLIYHEESCKGLADCIQQACLIRYQKMVDNKR